MLVWTVVLILSRSLTAWPAQTTLYVGKFFEVRDHDQPTKYVFSGETRIARVTGSLSTSTRIQRLRLYPGWNLCSVAVDGSFLPRGGEWSVNTAYQWNPGSGSWLAVSTNEPLSVGTVLWLHATTNSTLALTGTYADPTNRPIATGGSFLPGAGLEVWSILSTLNSPSTAAWHFDSPSQSWRLHAPSIPGWDPGFPQFIAPGDALFVNVGAPAELEIPEAALRVRYYHQNHLGSSSVVTDAQGALVEETAFYPFGSARHEHRLRQVEEDYKFTQKERDRESGLHYFEARYLSPGLARFISVDPLNASEARNPYAYAAGNPVKYLDPSGLDPEDGTDASASLEVGASYSHSGTSTTDWYEPITSEYRFNIAGNIGTESSIRGLFQGTYAGLKTTAEGKYSYNTAPDALWTLRVPFSVSARGTVGSEGLSYSGTASARYSLFTQFPMGSISMSFHGRGSSVPEYSLRQYGIGFYSKINAGVLPVPPPEAAFNATRMEWSQGVGLTARYVKQLQTSRLELAAGMGVGLNQNNVPQFTYPFARLSYSWGQARSWSRMPAELAAAAGVP